MLQAELQISGTKAPEEEWRQDRRLRHSVKNVVAEPLAELLPVNYLAAGQPAEPLPHWRRHPPQLVAQAIAPPSHLRRTAAARSNYFTGSRRPALVCQPRRRLIRADGSGGHRHSAQLHRIPRRGVAGRSRTLRQPGVRLQDGRPVRIIQELMQQVVRRDAHGTGRCLRHDGGLQVLQKAGLSRLVKCLTAPTNTTRNTSFRQNSDTSICPQVAPSIMSTWHGQFGQPPATASGCQDGMSWIIQCGLFH